MLAGLTAGIHDSVIEKIGALVLFFLLLAGLVMVILVPEAGGYELSLFDAYPFLFWLVMMAGIVISLSLILISPRLKSGVWRYGVLAYLLMYALVFFLPVVRGYEFFARYGHDQFAHLGWTGLILNSGHISAVSFYPASHILLAIISFFDIPLNLASLLISFFFSIIYVIFIFLLGRSLAGEKRYLSLYFIAFALPPMFAYFSTAFYPYIFSLCLLPLILYVSSKLIRASRVVSRKRIELVLLLAVVSMLLVFLHPLVAALAIAVYGIFALFFLSLSVAGRNTTMPVPGDKWLIAVFGYLIIFTAFLLVLWIYQQPNLSNVITGILEGLLDPSRRVTIYGYKMETIAAQQASIVMVVERFVKLYLAALVYLGLAGIGALYILVRLKPGGEKVVGTIFSLQFLAASAIGLIFLFGISIFAEPIRALTLPLVMATILCAIFTGILSEHTTTTKRAGILLLGTILILSFASVSGFLNLYASPWVGTPSPAMTQMECDGTDFYLSRSNATVPLLLNFDRISKYNMYHMAFVEKTPEVYRSRVIQHDIPDHFGYGRNETLLGTLGDEDHYLILRQSDCDMQALLFENHQSGFCIISGNDLELLGQDPTVQKVYSNRGFDLYRTGAVPAGTER